MYERKRKVTKVASYKMVIILSILSSSPNQSVNASVNQLHTAEFNINCQ